MMKFVYDGTYEGLLTTVFESFDRKLHAIQIIASEHYQPQMFNEDIQITSDATKATRVLKGLSKKLKATQVTDFWRAFLSENETVHQVIFDLICQIFREDAEILSNYGDAKVLLLAQTLRKVSRERHRMKAFIRFQKASDGLYTALVEPDFNVLPLIIPFFRNRYANQRWLIYDQKRKYGIYYDLHSVTEVSPSLSEVKSVSTAKDFIELDSKDALYEHLWKSYFQSTNIEARKNLKLHLRHVPKRYWKYLPEKSDKLKGY